MGGKIVAFPRLNFGDNLTKNDTLILKIFFHNFFFFVNEREEKQF